MNPGHYRHHFAQWDYSFDDEDAPGMRMLRSESFEARRCLDGHWLRHVQTIEGPGHSEAKPVSARRALAGRAFAAPTSRMLCRRQAAATVRSQPSD